MLVACPCNITQWRSARGGEPWRHSLSPHHYAGDVPRGAHVVAAVRSPEVRAAIGELVARSAD